MMKMTRLRLIVLATALLLKCIGSVSEVDEVRVEVNNATVLNATDSRSDSFADIIDRALEKEFPENDDQTTG